MSIAGNVEAAFVAGMLIVFIRLGFDATAMLTGVLVYQLAAIAWKVFTDAP